MIGVNRTLKQKAGKFRRYIKKKLNDLFWHNKDKFWNAEDDKWDD